MNRSDIAIIGGGISGLGVAHFGAKAGCTVQIFEQNKQLGGALQTKNKDDFWFELGGHTCYNSYETLIEILHDLDLFRFIQLRKREPFKIWCDGEFRSIFSQLNKLELLYSLPRSFWTKKKDQTVGSFYGNIVGKNNFTHTLSNIFSAVSSQSADEFPADLLFKKRPRDKKLPRSFTLSDGLQSIAALIVSHSKIQYKTTCEVKNIQHETEGYTIETNLGETYSSKYLAMATPPPVAAELLRGISPNLTSHLKELRCVNVESIGVAIDAKDLKIKRLSGAIARDEAFYSMVSRDVVPHKQLRGFTFHFAPNLLNYDEKIDRIADILGIQQHSIKYIKEATHTLPSFRLGHDKWLARTNQLLSEIDLILTGNYFSGMSIEDCLSRSKQQFFRLFR